MTLVANILKRKGDRVDTINCEATVSEAARQMVSNDSGSLLVTKDKRFWGIVTWHDLLRAAARNPDGMIMLPVAEVATREVETTREDAAIGDVEAQMFAGHFRHMPVLKDGVPVGVITLIDVLLRHLEDAERLNDDLAAYISGAYPR